MPSNSGSPSGPRVAPGERRALVVVVALLATAVVLVSAFDLLTPLPLLDEYARRWSIQQLVAGHGFQSLGSSPMLVQLILATPLALLKIDPAVWRLTAIPFLALQAIGVALIARDLGCRVFCAGVAGAAMVCNPLNLSLSTGMMTETVFLGLFALGLWSTLRWVLRGEQRLTSVLLIALATLQRPQGLGLAAVLLVGLAMARRREWSLRLDLPALVAALFLGLLSYRLPAILSNLSPSLTAGAPGAGAPTADLRGPVFTLFTLANLPPYIGLLALPFLPGLLANRPRALARGAWWMVPAGLSILGLVFAASTLLSATRDSIFTGNILTAQGLGATFLGGVKGSPLPPVLFIPFEALTVVSFVVVLMGRPDLWHPANLDPTRRLLLLAAAVQFVFILLHGQVFDRYFLAVLLPVLPILGWDSAQAVLTRWTLLWPLGVIGAWLAYYAVGTQDYLAWQGARHQVATIAYTQAPVDQVDAGFEEVAENVWLPANSDTTGTLPRNIVANPHIKLVFAAANDPRPGVGYKSIASGKIVIEHRPR